MLNSDWGVHDLDSLLFVAFRRYPGLQAKILQHFAMDSLRTFGSTEGAQSARPLQVVADFDDTLQANWLDRRVPRRTVYPGALQFLRELRLTSPAEAPAAEIAHHREGARHAVHPPAKSWPHELAKTAAELGEVGGVNSAQGGLLGRSKRHWQLLKQRWREHEVPVDASGAGAAAPSQAKGALYTPSSDDEGGYSTEDEEEEGGAAHNDSDWEALTHERGPSQPPAGRQSLHSSQIARAMEQCVPFSTSRGATEAQPQHLPLGGLLVLTARPAGVRNFVKSRTQGHLTALGLEPVSVLTGGVMHLATGQAIAEKKLQNLEKFLALFPEMDVTLLGDAGQADAAFFRAAMHQHGTRIKAAFLHDVTPDKATTGDGGSKQQYAAHGVRLFDTYVGAAAHALEGGVLPPPAALRVAAATVLECGLMCHGTHVQPLVAEMQDIMAAAGFHEKLPSLQDLQPAGAHPGGVKGGLLRSSVRRARWQQRLQRFSESVRDDLARLRWALK